MELPYVITITRIKRIARYVFFMFRGLVLYTVVALGIGSKDLMIFFYRTL